jgi:hypothetical protein
MFFVGKNYGGVVQLSSANHKLLRVQLHCRQQMRLRRCPPCAVFANRLRVTVARGQYVQR